MKVFTHRLLKQGVLIVVALFPLVAFGHLVFPYATSKTFFLYGAIEILFVVWISLVLFDSSYRLTKKEWLLLLPLLLYTGWIGVTTVTAVNPALSFWGTLMRGTGFLTSLHATVFALLLFSLIRKYGMSFARSILSWITISGFFVTLSVWLGDEALQFPLAILRKSSGGGLIGNSSLTATYFVFVLGASGVLFFMNDTNRKTKIRLGILVFFILFSPLFINLVGFIKTGVLLGSARAGVVSIGIFLGSSLLFFWCLSKKKVLRGLGMFFLVVSISAFSFFWFKLITPGTVIHDRFVTTASGTRFIFWDESQKVLSERPLLGYGAENFPIAQARYFDPLILSKEYGFEAWTDHPHNIYYDLGVAGGYPAIILYTIFIGSIFVAVYRGYRANRFSRIQGALLISTLLAYLFQLLFIFDSNVSVVMLFIWASIVYACSLNADKEGKISSLYMKKDKGKIVGMWILYLILPFSVYFFSLSPLYKSWLFADILADSVNHRPDRYHLLLKGSPVGNYWDVGGFAHEEYKLYAKNPLSVKSDQKLLPYAKKDVNAFISYAEEIAKTNTTDYRLYISLIHLYSTKIYLGDVPFNGALANHINEIIISAHTLAPNDPQVYWAKAQMAAWKGDKNGVITAYNEAIALEPKLVPAHTLLLEFLKGMGDKKAYTTALTAAQKAIPGFPEAHP